jgi:hypothetical protein
LNIPADKYRSDVIFVQFIQTVKSLKPNLRMNRMVFPEHLHPFA